MFDTTTVKNWECIGQEQTSKHVRKVIVCCRSCGVIRLDTVLDLFRHPECESCK